MGNKEKNFMSAVVYVHNAENSIEKLLGIIINMLEDNFEHSEIICVNDSSDDKSVSIIKKLSKNTVTTSISVLNMSYYHGLEAAMNAGVDLSIGDFVFEFDNPVADFEKSDIMKTYRKALEGYDIVSASPDKKQKITSDLFYRIFDRFAELKYEMYTESFRILSRRVINRINSMNKTVPYRKAIYANSGLKTEHLKYHTADVCSTVTKDREEKRYRSTLAVDSLILFTEIGYRFSIAMTSLMIGMTVFMAIYSLAVYILGNPVAGWTTTVLFLSFCFLGVFGVLTVVIKYLQIIVDLIFKRKKYSFESIEKLTR